MISIKFIKHYAYIEHAAERTHNVFYWTELNEHVNKTEGEKESEPKPVWKIDRPTDWTPEMFGRLWLIQFVRSNRRSIQIDIELSTVLEKKNSISSNIYFTFLCG